MLDRLRDARAWVWHRLMEALHQLMHERVWLRHRALELYQSDGVNIFAWPLRRE